VDGKIRLNILWSFSELGENPGRIGGLRVLSESLTDDQAQENSEDTAPSGSRDLYEGQGERGEQDPFARP